jgi:hypothetical protein
VSQDTQSLVQSLADRQVCWCREKLYMTITPGAGLCPLSIEEHLFMLVESEWAI